MGLKSNKTEIRKQIKSLEKMRKCTTKEFNMASYIRQGVVCETALCIAGDVVVRKLGMPKAENLLNGTDGYSFSKKAKQILGIHTTKLFYVTRWSDKNRWAYDRAIWNGDQNGMIDAGIAELKRYL